MGESFCIFTSTKATKIPKISTLYSFSSKACNIQRYVLIFYMSAWSPRLRCQKAVIRQIFFLFAAKFSILLLGRRYKGPSRHNFWSSFVSFDLKSSSISQDWSLSFFCSKTVTVFISNCNFLVNIFCLEACLVYPLSILGQINWANAAYPPPPPPPCMGHLWRAGAWWSHNQNIELEKGKYR